MSEWSAVTSREVHNTRREWLDSEGQFRAFVKLQVDWGDRFKLVQDLYTSALGVGGPPNGTGYNPRAYAGGSATSTDATNSPDMTQIGVTSATITSWPEVAQPRDVDNQIMDPKSSAFVDVQYGRRYNIEETIEFDSELIWQSHRDFKWQSKAGDKDKSNVHELEVPAVIKYDSILTREFIGLANSQQGAGSLTPDFKTLQECVGFTNSTTYTSIQLKGMVFKPGTLLMIEPEVRGSVDMQSFESNNNNNFRLKGFSVIVKFLHKKGAEPPPQAQSDTTEDTHNLFWRPRMQQANSVDKGGWDRLLIKEEGVQQTNYELYSPFEQKAEIDSNWLVPALYPIPVS